MSETAQRTSSNSPPGERLRIVIADDHDPTRVLLRTLIELEAMDVVGEAEDGNAAVALTLEHQPDAVLLDVNMPGLDGISAAEIIRARRPEIRLLLHTGEPLDTTRDRAAALHLPLADKRDLPKTIEQLAQQTGTRDVGADRAAAKRASARDGAADRVLRREPDDCEMAVDCGGSSRQLVRMQAERSQSR